MANADEALRKGLKAASDRFAKAMKTIAEVRTRKSAAAVNVVEGKNENLIRAGTPTGAWGWEPIQASMFDNNRRHPLFGDKSKWYKQGRYPITAYTERAALDDAAEAFADAFVPEFVKEYGFK